MNKNATVAAQTDPSCCRRTLVVGTALSVKRLHLVLQQIDNGPILTGCLIGPPVATQSKDGPVPVLGGFDDLLDVIETHPIEMVLISLPVALRNQTQRLTRQLDQHGTLWRFMPTMSDQLAGRLRPFAGETGEINTCELINRQPRPLDEKAIRKTLAGQCVLITGAGGSIGSELVRIVCRFAPSKVVLVDRSENGLFEIDRQVNRIFPNQSKATILHDVTDAPGTASMVATHRPDIIFHAAAHKHVPMMENHPAQAVENNFFGTRSIADAADKAGSVSRFVMISTDKAVNPSSVMGATKRLAELYIQDLNKRSQCIFSMVRFGNVLESACSVIPIWTQQLAAGEPITVTHAQMYRYFMTIPEAAGLVLQSAALSTGGEVFLLDMGKPIRILDLAHRFILCHGLEPEVDIPIRLTGPRPGEKLFEELAYAGEDMIPTQHDSVRIWRTNEMNSKRIGKIISVFDRLRAKGCGPNQEGHFWHDAKGDSIVAALHTAIPEMVTAAAAG